MVCFIYSFIYKYIEIYTALYLPYKLIHNNK